MDEYLWYQVPSKRVGGIFGTMSFPGGMGISGTRSLPWGDEYLWYQVPSKRVGGISGPMSFPGGTGTFQGRWVFFMPDPGSVLGGYPPSPGTDI